MEHLGETRGFCKIFLNFRCVFFSQNFENSASSFCRSRKMLQNEYLVAKIGVDAAENEPRKECCVVARSRKEWCRELAEGPAPGLCSNRHTCRSTPWCGPGMQDSVHGGPNHSNHSKILNIFCKICWNFEIWAVRRIANLVDLEKCWKN